MRACYDSWLTKSRCSAVFVLLELLFVKLGYFTVHVYLMLAFAEPVDYI